TRSKRDWSSDVCSSDLGTIVFRYGRLVNAFSVILPASAARQLAARPDVRSVQPVTIVVKEDNHSTQFIGAPTVWRQGFTGKGMQIGRASCRKEWRDGGW